MWAELCLSARADLTNARVASVPAACRLRGCRVGEVRTVVGRGGPGQSSVGFPSRCGDPGVVGFGGFEDVLGLEAVMAPAVGAEVVRGGLTLRPGDGVVEVAVDGGDVAAGRLAVLIACGDEAAHGVGDGVGLGADVDDVAGAGGCDDLAPHRAGGGGEFAGDVGGDGSEAVDGGFVVVEAEEGGGVDADVDLDRRRGAVGAPDHRGGASDAGVVGSLSGGDGAVHGVGEHVDDDVADALPVGAGVEEAGPLRSVGGVVGGSVGVGDQAEGEGGGGDEPEVAVEAVLAGGVSQSAGVVVLLQDDGFVARGESPDFPGALDAEFPSGQSCLCVVDGVGEVVLQGRGVVLSLEELLVLLGVDGGDASVGVDLFGEGGGAGAEAFGVVFDGAGLVAGDGCRRRRLARGWRGRGLGARRCGWWRGRGRSPCLRRGSTPRRRGRRRPPSGRSRFR